MYAPHDLVRLEGNQWWLSGYLPRCCTTKECMECRGQCTPSGSMVFKCHSLMLSTAIVITHLVVKNVVGWPMSRGITCGVSVWIEHQFIMVMIDS